MSSFSSFSILFQVTNIEGVQIWECKWVLRKYRVHLKDCRYNGIPHNIEALGGVNGCVRPPEMKYKTTIEAAAFRSRIHSDIDVISGIVLPCVPESSFFAAQNKGSSDAYTYTSKGGYMAQFCG